MESDRHPELFRTPLEACEDAFLRAYDLSPDYVKLDELAGIEIIRMHSTIAQRDIFINRPTVAVEDRRKTLRGALSLEDSYDYGVLLAPHDPSNRNSKRLYVYHNFFVEMDDDVVRRSLNDQESSMLVAEITSGHLVEVQRRMSPENSRWRSLIRNILSQDS